MKIIITAVLCVLLFPAISQEIVKIDPAMQKAILLEHNKERTLLNLENLLWDEELAKFAEEWAEGLAQEDNDISHRPDNEYGENIAYFFDDSLQIGVALWNEEKQYYKYKPIGKDFAKAGHYSQVIWSNTTHVGCGCAKGESGAYYFVCNYNPPGNVEGEKPY